jgi:hypothetical protein
VKRLAVQRSGFAATATAAAVAGAAGVASHGEAAPAAAVLVVSVALVMGIVDWRRSILGLLAYLPISGVLSIVLYPHTAPGALAKDALFVIPAYVGYALQKHTERRRIDVPAIPAISLAVIAALALVQMLNPAVPKLLVALIGAKTWLFYIPMVLVGHDLIRDRADLDRFLLVIALTAIVPCAIGVLEAALIYAGHANTVYGWYGSAASAVTQGFASISAGSIFIRRVPSTFTFATQYYSFTVGTLAIAYGAWRYTLSPRGHGRWGIALMGLILLASMLSGARSALLLTPAVLVGAVALDVGRRSWLRRVGIAVVAIVVGLGLATLVLGAHPISLLGDVAGHGASQLREVFVDGIRRGFRLTTFGLGTGVDTIASRYALAKGSLFQTVGGSWQESWWVKALLELGVVGLVAAAVFMVSVVVKAIRTTAHTTDPRLRAVCAAITAYLLWAVITNFKAQNLDLDPENVYFYLFIGVLLRLPALEHGVDPAVSTRRQAPPHRVDALVPARRR